MSKSILRTAAYTASAAAMIAASVFSSSASAETKLLFNIFVPPKHPFNTGMFQPWAKDVMKATDGRVKVEFTTASLAPPPKQWNMVSKGIADVAMLANIFERNRLQLPPIAQIPFQGGASAESRSLALWRTHKKYFEKANEYKGMHVAGQWTISGSQFFHNKKPLTSFESLRKEKMWAIAGLPNKMMTELGAVVVSVPGVKMFDVMSKGVVNGTVTSPYTLLAFKLMPYVGHITLIPGGFNSNTFSLLFNKKKWDGLSKQDQEAINSVSGDTVARNAGKRVDQLDAIALKQAKEKGIPSSTVSPQFMADMKAKLTFAEEGWLKVAAKKGVDGPAALAFFRSEIQK